MRVLCPRLGMGAKSAGGAGGGGLHRVLTVKGGEYGAGTLEWAGRGRSGFKIGCPTGYWWLETPLELTVGCKPVGGAPLPALQHMPGPVMPICSCSSSATRVLGEDEQDKDRERAQEAAHRRAMHICLCRVQNGFLLCGTLWVRVGVGPPPVAASLPTWCPLPCRHWQASHAATPITVQFRGCCPPQLREVTQGQRVTRSPESFTYQRCAAFPAFYEGCVWGGGGGDLWSGRGT